MRSSRRSTARGKLAQVPREGALALIEDERFGVRVFLSNIFVSMVNPILLAAVFLTFAEPVAAAIATAQVVASVATGTLVAATGSRWPLAISWTSNLALSIAGHIVLGGYLWSGGSLFWGLIVVFSLAIAFDNPRATYGTMALIAVVALVLAVLEPTLRESREQPDLAVSVFVFVDILLVSMLLIAPIILALVDQVRKDQVRNRELMLNILPETIADRLKAQPGMIADHHDGCTILFADLVGFTAHSKGKDPTHLVGELNTIFTRFDALAADHGAEKIKTIGDGYMAATGLPDPDPDHVTHACDLALAMVDAMPDLNAQLGTDFQLRVGVNTGSAVAGVVGTSKFSYDVWGETVNLASRLESNGAPGIVAVSASVAGALDGQHRVEALGVKELKGEGPTQVYRLHPRATEPA